MSPPQDNLCIYTVNSFANTAFSGNPAAVCLDNTEQGLTATRMQKIAAEMNLSDTAFIRPNSGQDFVTDNQSNKLKFQTMHSGTLYATRRGEQIGIELPLNTPTPVDFSDVKELLKCIPAQASEHSFADGAGGILLIRLADSLTRQEFERLRPAVDQFTTAYTARTVLGVILTMRGGTSNGCVDADGVPYDFVSRFFAPWSGIAEDSVTGAAHTVLAGYWSEKLGKDQLFARQCSARGGDLWLKVNHQTQTLDVTGDATIVMEGKLRV